MFSAAAKEVWVEPGEWTEEIINGRGHYAEEVKKCTAASRRRRHRRLQTMEEALPLTAGRQPTRSLLLKQQALRWPWAEQLPHSEPERSSSSAGPRRRAGDDGQAPLWQVLAGDREIAADEGRNMGNKFITKDEDCFKWCDETTGCRSVTRCEDRNCYLKDRAFTGSEETMYHRSCKTYFFGPPADPARLKVHVYPKEVPEEEPRREWEVPPVFGEASAKQRLEQMVTRWSCVKAHGSHYTATRKTCHFHNLYYVGHGGDGVLFVNLVKNQTTDKLVAELKKGRINGGANEANMGLGYTVHNTWSDFAKWLRGGHKDKVVVQRGLTVAYKPIYHFNVGHALFDGLYPMFVSMLQHGLQDVPARALVMSNWEGSVESVVPGMYRKVEDVMASILGLEREAMTCHKMGWGATKQKQAIHRLEEAVVGCGTNSQKIDMNVNMTLGACRELDACRAFRRHTFKMQGLPQPAPARTSPKFRVILIENKRYVELQKIAAELEAMTNEGGTLADFQVRFVKWSPGKHHEALQSGNFTRHMEIIAETDIHISGPGTGQMYQTFLPDGAVHIHLGDGQANCWRGDKGCMVYQGFMEEYMAEGAPYLRALFHPKYTEAKRVTAKSLVPLIQEAGRLLRGGLPARAPPIGAKLSPIAKVWKAYCYWNHADKFGMDALRKLIVLWEMKGETWLGNQFPEAVMYSGIRGNKALLPVESCLLNALRASFDKTFPDMGHFRNYGWFGTSGELAGNK